MPGSGTFKPITPLCFLTDQVKVSSLISNGQGRKELVNVLFYERDKEIILNIPLCPHRADDTMVWHYPPKWIFTVSSTYKVGLQQEMDKEASTSCVTPSWEILWNRGLPPKVKIFAWQLCHRALAMGSNLCYRNIKTKSGCVRCSYENEDDMHIFFKCEFAVFA